MGEAHCRQKELSGVFRDAQGPMWLKLSGVREYTKG